MKEERGAWRPVRQEEMYRLRNEDSYRQSRKPVSARCPKCGASFHAGRWTWEAVPDTEEQLCPACHRIRDDQPAGEVLVQGEFGERHCDELLHLVRNIEAREKAAHPLERLMGLAPVDDGMLISTTGVHLARCIGQALHAAYKGTVEYRYRDADEQLFVTWSR